MLLAPTPEPGGTRRVSALRRRLGWGIDTRPVVWLAFSAMTLHVLAVHMTFGVVNEWTTQAGYLRLAAEAGHPVLGELLKRIMRQEGTHIAFYRSQAVERLEANAAADRKSGV